MKYFIVPIQFVAEHQRRSEGERGLFFVQDNSGRWVINVEVADVWPELDFSNFEIVTLTVEDFPTPENE